jgi:hypothetical protein
VITALHDTLNSELTIVRLFTSVTNPYISGVTLGFYFGTGSKSSDLNEIFLMCYK